MTATRTRSRRGQGDLLRDEILDAAEALLREAGSFEAVSLRAIAQAVGVSAPSIYLHFTDKDDLFFHVCDRRFGEFAAILEGAVATIDDPVDRIVALGRAYVRYGVANPEHYRVLFGEKMESMLEGRDLSEANGTRAFAILVAAVAAATEEGLIRGDDPVLTAFGMWAAVHGVVMLELARGELERAVPYPDAVTLGDHVIDAALTGLRTGG